MNKGCGKIDISDYSFLRLLTSSIILKSQNPIIKNHELEKNLYKFYNRPEFHYLFEGICKKEDVAGENNYVDLNRAFQQAYAYGLLSQIHDCYRELMSVINFSIDEAIQIQSEYTLEQVESITNLCNEMLEPKEQELKHGNMLIKRKKITFQ